MAYNERFARTYWTLVGVVVVLVVALIGLASSQTDVRPRTASNEPAVTTPGAPPAVKPQTPPSTP